jgi:hypothetical protein
MAKIVELDSNVQDKIMYTHANGQTSGYKIGFENLDKLYSVKAKRTTIIYGRPTDGKSQLLLQMLCALACNYGKKSLIYMPETGDVDEVYTDIIHCLVGKGFNKHSFNYRISENELYNVMPFVKEHFKVVEIDENDFNLDNWLELSKQAVDEFGVFATAADNWNDIDHASEAMISEYLKRNLVKWNRHAKKHNYHGFVVTHAKNPQIVKGELFPRPARVDEIDGGYAWYAKAMNMILIHREYIEMQDEYVQSSVAEIHIKKLKKRSEGMKGICKLDFDIYQNCYKTIDGLYLPTPFKKEFENNFNNTAPF